MLNIMYHLFNIKRKVQCLRPLSSFHSSSLCFLPSWIFHPKHFLHTILHSTQREREHSEEENQWRILGNSTPRSTTMPPSPPVTTYTTTFTVVLRSSAFQPSPLVSKITLRFSEASTPHDPPPFRSSIFPPSTTPRHSSIPEATLSTTPKFSEPWILSFRPTTCFTATLLSTLPPPKKPGNANATTVRATYLTSCV